MEKKPKIPKVKEDDFDEDIGLYIYKEVEKE